MKETNDTSWKAKIIKGAAFALGVAAGTVLISKSINKSKKIELKDKVILITGGGRGLGLILARKLAETGATIVICGRSEETLQKAAVELASRTDKHLEISCNITNKEEVKRLIHRVKNEVGSIDILINNAGVIKVGPMETLNQLDYEEAMNTHFWGPYYLINEVLPDMKERGSGNIVNIASIGSKVSFPHLIPYNASKFALSGLSEGLGTELKKYNINVTTVYPGLMRTGSPRNIDVKGQHEKEYAWFKISDSLPLISMSADRAADKIIDALRMGKRTITLSIPAKIAVAVHGIAPAVTMTAFDLIDFLLPRKKDGEKIKKGYESESKITKSFLTKKTEEAAEKNLEK
jgi:short-subunit dehydrogenase